MKAYVYILKCSDNTYYTGYTTNLEKRLKLHNEKKASKYTRARTPVEYVYTKECSDKIEAMKLEYRIKQLTRKNKQKIINGHLDISI